MSNAFLLYDNVLPGASSITVTSEASGYEKEYLYDGLTWGHWKPSAAGTVYCTVDLGSAQSMDAWGVVAHDLGTNGASIELQYSATGAWAGEEVTVGSAVSPTSTETIMKTFTSVSARYWRWKIISASAASQIGQLLLGARLEMQTGLRTGFMPDDLAPRYESRYNMSDEAALLGESVYKKPVTGKMMFTLLTPAWVRANWEPFLRHIEQGGSFLYQPQPDNYPENVIFAVADKKKLSTPKYSHSTYMSVDLSYIGLVA